MTSNSPDDDKTLAEQRQREGVERERALFLEELGRAGPSPSRRGLSLVWTMLGFVALAAVVTGGYFALHSSGLSDAEIRERIIKESTAAYQASGRPCACPFDVRANGQPCGDFSAYSKPGAAAPLCYGKDVSDAMVRDWRQRNTR